MREALFILVVLLALLGLTAYRYRKQIAFAIQIWRTMKGVREIQSQQVSEIDARPESKGELVNCSRCGKWTPVATAIKFSPTIYYCSTGCVRRTAKN